MIVFTFFWIYVIYSCNINIYYFTPIIAYSPTHLIITDETSLEEYDGEYTLIEEVGGDQKTIVYETVRKNGTTTSLDHSGTYLIDNTVYDIEIQYSNTIYLGIMHIIIGILSIVWAMVRLTSKRNTDT